MQCLLSCVSGLCCAHITSFHQTFSVKGGRLFSHYFGGLTFGGRIQLLWENISLHPAVFVIWILAYIYFSTNVIMLLNLFFKEFYVVEKKKKIMLLDSEPHVLGQGERFVHANVFAALS